MEGEGGNTTTTGGPQKAMMTKRIPHYALKTVAYSAPDFANAEQDVVRQSFSTGNYTWMKEALPVELGPDAINLLRRQRMERNRLAEPLPQTWSKMSQLWGGGFYQEFEYIPDSFERKHEMEMRERKESEDKRRSMHKHEWRKASQEVKLKHEPLILTTEAFENPGKKELYPYLGSADAFTIPPKPEPLTLKGPGRDADLQIEGAFLSGRGKGLEDNGRMSRMRLPTIIKRLQQRLDEDWDDTTVVVSATDQDLVQIAYYMASVDSERGVLAYMNILSKDSELLDDLGLRKVSQLWGMKRDFTKELQAMSRQGESSELDASKGENSLGFLDEEGHSTENPENTWMFFLLSPKWVKMRATDAYYTVHPRAQGSQFRMSTAGSSVLLSLGSSVFDPLESVQATPGATTLRGGASAGFGGPTGTGSMPASGRFKQQVPPMGGAGIAEEQKGPDQLLGPKIDLGLMDDALKGFSSFKSASKKDGDENH